MPKYEYMLKEGRFWITVTELNRLGADGWQLVHVESATVNEIHMVFMREVVPVKQEGAGDAN